MNTSFTLKLRAFLANYGFFFVLAATFLFFSAATDNFLSVGNLINVFHTMVPLTIMALGLALVIIAGNIDISIGSIAFLSASIGIIAMRDFGLHPILGALITLGIGGLCGLVNAVIVVRFGVDPLITTLGTMIAFRGLALELTNSVMIQLPEEVRGLGNVTLGPIYADMLIGLAFVVGIHIVHTCTFFGRTLTAIGNDRNAAFKVGLPVKPTIFASFVLSGLLAAFAGMLTTLQIGAVSAFLGQGAEFSALAAVVVGGISLLGGRGNLLVGVLLGAALFEFIRNGLTHLGADPYSYRLLGGAVIFVAMYADAIRSSLRLSRRKAITQG